MRLFSLLLSGLVFFLAACGPPPDTVGLEAAEAEINRAPVDDGSCNAELFGDLIGEPITVVDNLGLTGRVRILPADSFVTRDFDPNRLTFTTTRDDTVGRVFCG